MPEDLLLELESPAPGVRGLDSIEDLVRIALRHEVPVGLAVEGLKGSAQTFENAWQRIVIEVANGQTAEVQATRSRLRSAFDKRLKLLRDTHAVAQWLRSLGSAHVADPDVLLPEIDRMERLQGNVFDRWQTAEDLEELAARDYPLTTADLNRIGPQRRPPASFYAEESKPF